MKKIITRAIFSFALLLSMFAGTIASAQSGAALDFDGVDDYIDLGTGISSSLNGTSAITVEAWVYPTTLNAYNTIVGDYVTGGPGGLNYLLRLDNDKVLFSINNETFPTTTNGVSLYNWSHIAGTWDGTTVNIYINGVLQISENYSGVFSSNVHPSTIGTNAGNPAVDLFTGQIDELSIWTRPLDQSEIQGNMACPINPSGQIGLLALYHFDQGDAYQPNPGMDTLSDASGNNFNGTLTNFALSGSTSNWLAPGAVTMPTWYADADNDGFGDGGVSQQVCLQPGGYVSNSGDCNDADDQEYPRTFFWDADGDGFYGTANVICSSATPPPGYSATNDDCNDNDNSLHTPPVCQNGGTVNAVCGCDCPPGFTGTLCESILASALNFDGVDDYVDLGNFGNYGTSDFTIEAWFKTATTASGSIISKREDCGHENFWQVGILSGMIEFQMDEDINGTNYVDLVTPLAYNDDQWHHLACTRNGIGLKIYIDGVLVVSQSTAAATYLDNPHDLLIGKGACGFFEGSLDEIRIWNRALCEGEMNHNRQCELDVNGQNGIEAIYHFNQGTPDGDNTSPAINYLADAGWYGRNGTMNNFSLDGSGSNWTDPGGVTQGAGCGSAYINVEADMPGIFVSNTLICAGDSTTLSIQSGSLNDATEWRWYEGWCGGNYIGSGTSIKVSPGFSTWYNVRGEGDCVWPGMCANIMIDVNNDYFNIGTNGPEICPGQSIQFWLNGNNSVVTDLAWDFGDGTTAGSNNINHVFPMTDPATYHVTLHVTTNNACGSYDLSTDILVSSAAIPNAEVYISNNGEACPGDAIQFYPNDWNLSSYFWDFGDGNTSTTNGPTHSYATEGDYTVTLIVTNSCGNSDTSTQTAHIQNGLEIPNWVNIWLNNVNNNTVCINEPVQFGASYTVSSYTWDFDDPGSGSNTSADAQPYHTFSSPGVYTVSVLLTNGCGDTLTVFTTVTVDNNTAANPSSIYVNGASIVCPNDVINFYANSQAQSYDWDFGDGSVHGSGQQVNHAYTSDGNYMVTLTITNYCGNTASSNTSIIVDHSNTTPPVIFPGQNFGMASNGNSGYNGCANDTLLFYAIGGAHYEWDFGDGTTTTQTFPISIQGMTADIAKHAYTANGIYWVKISFYNGCEISSTDSFQVNVGSSIPVSGGTAPLSPAYYTCDTATFIAFGGNTYEWDFGDGSPTVTTNDITVHHAYSTPSTYSLTLTVTNGCGNTATYHSGTNDGDLEFVHVIAIPVPVVYVSGNFLYSSISAASYQWFLNDHAIPNATDPNYIAPVSGNYKVQIIDTNGCSVTSATVCVAFINEGPNVTVCTGGSVTLHVTGVIPGNTYLWDDINATTSDELTLTDLDAGTYTVTVTSAGCVTTATTTVTVDGSLTANAGNDVTINQGQSTLLQGSGGGNYLWSPSATLSCETCPNTVASPSVTTNYTLTVTGGTGCTASDDVLVTVCIKPDVPSLSATATSICHGSSTTLSIASGDLNSATDWVWYENWCGGTPVGTGTSIIVTPDWNTTYYVRGEGGCVNPDMCGSISVDVNHDYFTVGSSTTQVCPGSQVQFWVNGNNSVVTGLSWDFGDGSTANSNNIGHIFPMTDPATYHVTLHVDANNACASYDTSVTILVSSASIPNAGVYISNNGEACPGDPVQFYPSDWNLSSYSWDLGDGTTSAIQNPNHSYATDGDYTVILIVSNSCGNYDTSTQTVHILNNLQIPDWSSIYLNNVNNNTVCVNEPVQFSSGYTVGSYAWNFGDAGSGSNTSADAQPYHTFSAAGTYNVSVLLTNGCGDTMTMFTTVTVNNSTLASPSSIYINGASTVCPDDVINFYAQSQAMSYDWNFGDGSAHGSGQQANHSYATDGNYTVTLTITNYCGNTASSITSITVDHSNPNPPVIFPGQNFGMASNGNSGFEGCAGDTLVFYAIGGAHYEWDFGDGTTITQTFPISIQGMTADIAKHSYAANGTYTATITYYNGCDVSATDSIQVNVGSSIPVSGGMAPLSPAYYSCDTNLFIGFGGNTYVWDFGDGSPLDTSGSIGIQHAYSAPGTYSLTLTITNGCGNTATYHSGTELEYVHVIAIPLPVVNVSGYDLSSTPASGYQWYLNDTAIVNATAQNYTALVSGNYKVQITDTNGCTATSTPACLAIINEGSNVSVCPGGFVTLHVTGVIGGNTYLWDDINATNTDELTVADSDAGTYMVTVTSAGCVATATTTVTVDGSLAAHAGNDVNISQGQSALLQGTGGGNYSWDPSATLSCATCPNTFASPTVTTTYTLTVTGGSGCTASDDVTVSVCDNPDMPVLTASANPVCSGDTTLLSIVSGGLNDATDWHWFTGSCGETHAGNGSSISVSPTITTTYYVRGEGGCVTPGACEAITVTVNQPSTITCPGDTILYVLTGTCGNTASYTAPVTGSPAPTLSYELTGATTGSGNGTGSLSTFNKGVTTVTIIASNVCYSDTCSFTVTVNDDELPLITCPSNISVNNDTGQCGAIVNYTAPVGTDNCPGANTIQTAGLASGANFPIGVTTNTFEVTDASGNTATCSFTVTVTDNELPAISCPSNISVNTDSNLCTATVSSLVTPITNDNCGVQTISNNAPTIYPIGNTNVTWTVTDIHGNTATCVQVVTVTNTNVVAVNISTPATTICNGNVVTFTATPTHGGTNPIYQWKVNNINKGTNSPNFTPTSLANGNVVTCVMTSNIACPSGSIIATSNPIQMSLIGAPAKPGAITQTSGNLKLCPGDTASFEIVPVLNATDYTWTAPSGATIISGQNTNGVTLAFNTGFAANGSLSVTASNSCGYSQIQNKNITRNKAPVLNAITGSTSVPCMATGVSYNLNAIADAGFNWYFNSTTASVASGNGTNSILADFDGFTSATLYVSATTGCGTSALKSMAIKYMPENTGAISGPNTVCSLQTNVAYSITPLPHVLSYTWTAPAGATLSDGMSTQSGTLITGSPSVTINFGTKSGAVKVKSNNCSTGAVSQLTVSTTKCGRSLIPMEVPENNSISLFPNPAKDLVNVVFTADKESRYHLRVYDALGKEVLQQEVNATEGSNQVELHISHLSGGVYQLLLESGNNHYKARFTVE